MMKEKLRLFTFLTSSGDCLMARVPRVEFSENGSWNSLKHLFREDTQQLPSDVQRLEDGAVLIVALSDEILLEFSQELQIQQVIGRKSLLTDDSLHGLNVLSDGVASVELIRHV